MKIFNIFKVIVLYAATINFLLAAITGVYGLVQSIVMFYTNPFASIYIVTFSITITVSIVLLKMCISMRSEMKSKEEVNND